MTRTSLLLLATSMVVALATSTLVSCVDFGYRLPDPPSATDASVTDDDGSSDCVEGVVPPSVDGPQVLLITLAVDQPILNVASGDVVTWTNSDTMQHTVTAGAPGAPLPPAQGGFDSGVIGPGGTWAYRFCSARTAVYYCATHPSQMNNYRVIVGP